MPLYRCNGPPYGIDFDRAGNPIKPAFKPMSSHPYDIEKHQNYLREYDRFVKEQDEYRLQEWQDERDKEADRLLRDLFPPK